MSDRPWRVVERSRPRQSVIRRPSGVPENVTVVIMENSKNGGTSSSG